MSLIKGEKILLFHLIFNINYNVTIFLDYPESHGSHLLVSKMSRFNRISGGRQLYLHDLIKV